MAMSAEQLVDGVVWYFVFLLSVTAHEAAHAASAKRLGDPTADEAGLVTLNPLPHIQREPVGMVLAPLIGLLHGGFGLGWGSAPYDHVWQRRFPKRAALMALAGPASNVALAIIAGALLVGGMHLGVFIHPTSISSYQLVAAAAPGAMEGAAALLSVLFTSNIFLAAFNLLPIPPLDGSSIITLFMSKSRASRFLDSLQSGQLSLIGLLIALPLGSAIALPVFRFGVRCLYALAP